MESDKSIMVIFNGFIIDKILRLVINTITPPSEGLFVT